LTANGRGRARFEPDYYVEFDPTTARELVFRTPGFNMQQEDGGRGLSGVRSNILINGMRPPSKGQSVEQQLREIPVHAVARIELIDAGARLDIDMQGYPQVINVVTVPDKPAAASL
jgi:outer membrane cobalamin receptor